VGRVSESLRAFSISFANPQLRRLQVAGVGSTLGNWAYGVALAVYAYHAGGTRTVGLLLAVRWGLSAAAAPWLAVLADRISRRRVMLASDIVRIGLVGGMAALVAGQGPALAVYALAVASSAASTAFQPAQAALLPSLAATPEELTSANVAMSTIGSVGMLAGPALGGVLLAVSRPWVVFAVTAATIAWSAGCVLRLRPDRPPASEGGAEPLLSSMLAGFRAIASEPALRVVVGLTGAQTLVTGVFEVLLVVVALRLLGAGNSGVGWLNAAFGVGGVLGALVVASLAGRKRLAADLGLGVLLWGVPMALVAVWANLGFALLLVAAIGIGNTLADVAGMTLLQRTAADEVLGRVFGVLESLILATLAIGAAIAPALVSALGIRTTLVLAGLVLPAVVLLLAPKLRAIDAASGVPAEALELLRSIDFLGALPTPVLERLSIAATPVTVRAGETVFSRGDSGDRFYAIASGRVAVDVDEGDARELGPGEFFGEIALLRDVPRTATVRALDDVRLYALERDAFIAAVTGHAPSHEAADHVVAVRLPAAIGL
jgi:MFS family permease